MVALTKTKGGKVVAIGTAKITSQPQFRTFDSGNSLTSFYANSDTSGKGKDRQFESYKINAWGEWSDYANVFEKGDVIYVEGECSKDDYNSKRNGSDEFMINVQLMFPVNIGVEVMGLRMMLDDMRKSTPNAQKKNQTKAAKPNEQVDTSGFTDIDPNDMPWEQGGDYESSI